MPYSMILDGLVDLTHFLGFQFNEFRGSLFLRVLVLGPIDKNKSHKGHKGGPKKASKLKKGSRDKVLENKQTDFCGLLLYLQNRP